MACALTAGSEARRSPAPPTEPSARPQVMRAVVLHVLDGDTMLVRPLRGKPGGDATSADPKPEHTGTSSIRPLRVRLSGIDAPELCQRGGGEARQALATLVAGQAVTVAMLGLDRYARILGRVSVGGTDVATHLVAQGLAWSDEPPGARRGPYGALEAAARAQHRGVFADADAQRPKDFRDRHGACPHAPGSRLKRLGESGRG